LKIYNIGKYQHCWGNSKAIKDRKADISAWRKRTGGFAWFKG